MSAVQPVSSSLPTELPSKPSEAGSTEADVPDYAAVCSSFLYRDSSALGNGRSESPAPSSISNDESLDAVSIDPSKIITDEMLAEEKLLHSDGIKAEENRKEEEERVLNEMTVDSKEQRYERLKYLLSKSTLYTEYLVNRMKQQKEEDEKRREKIMNRKAKKACDEEQAQQGEKVLIHRSSARGAKRKQEADFTEANTAQKRQRRRKSEKVMTGESASEKESEDKMQADSDGATCNTEESSQSTESSQREEDEPEIAAEFDVPEDSVEERYINGELVPPQQPKLMEGGVLRPYQVEGYNWLKVLYENGVNGILADEMGLGKTVQCVALLSHLVYMGVPGPFMICAPLSTIPNWFSEFERFAPQVPTVLYHGHKDQRQHLCKKIRRKCKIREGVFCQPVVITSYEIAMIDRRLLGNNEWKYLIVDEGHRIKNTHCRLIRELRMYNSTHRILLTGTPLQNSLAELWSLLNFLLPEIFDDLGSFEAWFDVDNMNDEDTDEKIVRQEEGHNILSMLHQILTPFMLRRLKSDVDLHIPPKKEVLVYAPLTLEQKTFYSALVDRSIFSLIEDKNKCPEATELTEAGRPKRRSSRKVDYSIMFESETERNQRLKCEVSRRWSSLEAQERELEDWVVAVCDFKSVKLEKKKEVKSSQVTIKMRNVMMQLRKCCNHPYLLEHPLDPATGDLALTEGVVTTSGKMLVLDRMLKELQAKGHRVLIFSQMTRMLDLIEDFCQIRGYDFCRLDGTTHVDDRRDSMIMFNKNPDKFLFLLSTRAGGLGINLTGADTVIIYDSDWNPQCDLQAQDRCHRIGQTKPVVVYRFVTANTIDQKIIERAAAKRKLEKMVIYKGKFKSGNLLAKIKPISPQELRDLLQSKDHDSEVKGEGFCISDDEMMALLDRSDLYRKWKNGPEKTINNSVKSSRTRSEHRANLDKSTKTECKEENESHLFKIVDTDGGDSTKVDTSDETSEMSSVVSNEESTSVTTGQC